VSKVRIRTIVFTAKHEIPRRTYSFISARTRGGLVTRCDDLVGILEIAEISFRQKLNESEEIIRSIPIENINLFDNNELFTSEVFVGKYYHVSRCQSSTTQTLLLGIVIRLYLKVRSFSYAKDYTGWGKKKYDCLN
jgi:hypothetical protein